MNHIVLLGDSIFDNALYVADEAPVIEQLRKQLHDQWQATLLAIDGCITKNVSEQLISLPADATHLFISAGGNDALFQSGILHESAYSVAHVLERFTNIQKDFQHDYRKMLQEVLSFGKHTVVCTIYDSIPGLDRISVTALSMFNDIILREAFMAKIPVIDLRMVCNDASDYSEISPIEPSATGGEKIVKTIVDLLERQDFNIHQSIVYP